MLRHEKPLPTCPTCHSRRAGGTACNKIKSASGILPVTEKADLPAQFGLRHRLCIGLTEANDATAIIESEESGEISYANKAA